ncbi:MAG: hypothetical protein JSS07_06630 [Proteobacteria bacterium]|nr:hypothetical protein [Pseudomonadota bacterium]
MATVKRIGQRGLNALRKYFPSIMNMLENYQISNFKAGIKLDELVTGVTVFWATDAGLAPHFVSQCILAKTLKENHFPVILIRCKQNYSRCIVMESVSLSSNKDKKTLTQKQLICNQCQKNMQHMATQYQLPMLDLEDLLEVSMTDLEKCLPQDIDALVNFSYEGLHIGKICAGEVIRTRKKNALDFVNPEECAALRQYILSALTNYLAFKKLSSIVKVGHVAFYGDYAPIIPVAYLAHQNKIPVTNIANASIGNVKRSQVVLMSAYSAHDYFLRLKHWEEMKQYPLTPGQVIDISKDLFERFYSNLFTVFSPNKTQFAQDLLAQFKLNPSRKTIVAFTSSLDEVFAVRLQYEGVGLNVEAFSDTGPFKNQIDWLKHLSEYVEHHDEYQLLIRIHPREGFDGYQVIESEHLMALRQAFADKQYQHVHIIWPCDKISSYDLAEIADLVVVAWTSLGLEVARLGVPVLAAFRYTAYPFGEFIHWQATKDAYFNEIEKLTQYQATSLSTILYAYRWFYIQRLGASVDIQDMAPYHDFNTLPEFKMPAHADKIVEVFTQNKSLFETNMSMQKSNLAEQEEHMLKAQMRKSLFFILTGCVLESDYQFVLFNNEEMDISLAKQYYEAQFATNHTPHILFSIKAGNILLVDKAHSFVKYSPMAARLAQMLA